jgi:hypothetical protein
MALAHEVSECNAVELICRGRELSGGAMKLPHFHHMYGLDSGNQVLRTPE